jgi:hypothetical protein
VDAIPQLAYFSLQDKKKKVDTIPQTSVKIVLRNQSPQFGHAVTILIVVVIVVVIEALNPKSFQKIRIIASIAVVPGFYKIAFYLLLNPKNLLLIYPT